MARRHFKERPDYLNTLSNIELIERYRFDRDGLNYLDGLLHDILKPSTQRNCSVSSITKILIALRFYATGGIQLNDGDIHGVTQPTVSRAIHEVTNALSSPVITTNQIQFPIDPVSIRRNNEDFFGIAGFPHVIGVIDGTHVQIKAPTIDEAAYVNRMGYHSINTQIVFDGTDKIIDLVARWPGSAHDSRILRQSGLCQLFDGGHVPGANNYLLGDSGYPCKKWLLTPYLNPNPGSETEYNRAHKKTRAKVERGIGQLKRRWGVLHGEIRLDPEKACKVIVSCAVLHNICKDRNIPMIDDIGPPQINNNRIHVYRGPENGLQYRRFITNTYF